MTKGEINYKNGKIYKIEPICEHDEGDVYIGSTTKQYLSQRMTAHRGNYKRFKYNKVNKRVRAFDLFDKYGIENCDIILIEQVEANSIDELHIREAHYIKTIKCNNKMIPTRTQQEWRDENKEKMKQYRDDHKDKQKQYWKNHKDKYAQLKHQRYQEKKEELNQKGLCQCGSVYSQVHKLRHERTKKHIDFMMCLPSSSDSVSEVV